jgi:hypothetical protein
VHENKYTARRHVQEMELERICCCAEVETLRSLAADQNCYDPVAFLTLASFLKQETVYLCTYVFLSVEIF